MTHAALQAWTEDALWIAAGFWLALAIGDFFSAEWLVYWISRVVMRWPMIGWIVGGVAALLWVVAQRRVPPVWALVFFGAIVIAARPVRWKIQAWSVRRGERKWREAERRAMAERLCDADEARGEGERDEAGVP